MRAFASVLLAVVVAQACIPISRGQPADATGPAIAFPIDPQAPGRAIAAKKLGGTNIALWVGREVYDSAQTAERFTDAGLTLLRIPGGSWSDVTFWNGNGVRDAQGKVDPKKMVDGYPAIDYSAYAPTIVVNDKPPYGVKDAGGFHGNVDVRALHEFIGKAKGEALVCVNAGTGRPLDAAEWLKWTKNQGYAVGRWEIGNELDGGWESGHIRRDGSTMTPELYASIYRDFATALKRVDPAAKVGGPASGAEASSSFSEAILRDAGDLVDFVSLHTYPGSSRFDDQQQFATLKTVGEQVERVREWIRTYQPDRQDQIEIGYTEWNLPGTRVACELDAALWVSLFLREMAIHGVDFSTQWDAFTHGNDEEGGHALFQTLDGVLHPKSQYWAFSMWNRLTGDQIIGSGTLDGTQVDYLTTRGPLGVSVMFINRSRDQSVAVRPELVDAAELGSGLVHRLTHAEYFWNPVTHRVDFSGGPRIEPATQVLDIPPFSVVYAVYPNADSPPNDRPMSPPYAVADRLEIVTPTALFANEPVTVWVRSLAGEVPAPIPGVPATVRVSNGVASSTAVRLDESAGRFTLTPTAAGDLTLDISAGSLTKKLTLAVAPSEPRPVVVWDAIEPALDPDHGYTSDWAINRDETVRANEPVVAVDLSKPNSTQEGNPNLVRFTRIPGEIDRAGIRGAFFDLKTSPGFAKNNPGAQVQIVVQSSANWWMDLGRVELADPAAEQWATHVFPITSEEHLKSVGETLNLWLVLRNAPAKGNGTVYIDRAGFMVR